MSVIKWGPEIAVNGEKPKWLAGDEVCCVRLKGDLLGSRRYPVLAREWAWSPVTSFCLRSDHPHYATVAPEPTKAVDDSHYAKLAIQPLEYSMANGLDAMQHTIVKYVTRFRDKHAKRDLLAARDVIDMLIAREYGGDL